MRFEESKYSFFYSFKWIFGCDFVNAVEIFIILVSHRNPKRFIFRNWKRGFFLQDIRRRYYKLEVEYIRMPNFTSRTWFILTKIGRIFGHTQNHFTWQYRSKNKQNCAHVRGAKLCFWKFPFFFDLSIHNYHPLDILQFSILWSLSWCMDSYLFMKAS